MPEYPHLPNAPIREALVDFRVRAVPGASHETLREVADGLAADFPDRGPIHQFQGEIQLGREGPLTTQKGPLLLGYRLNSPDGLNVAQVRIDGFTFSRLHPYQSWDGMIRTALDAWRRYVETVQPIGIERIATRFVNRIVLTSSGDLREIFRVPPAVPDGSIETFLFRYQLAPADGVTAIVSLATEDSPEASIILDIDCFVRKSLPINEETLSHYLPMIRDAKNRIFFGSLTDQTIERYQ